MTDDTKYATVVFLNAVVPLLRPLAEANPKLFANRTGVVQISALSAEGVSIDGRPARLATHLVLEAGLVRPVLGPHVAPNLELEFAKPEALVAFFTGNLGLPKIRGGFANAGLLADTIQALLAMSSLLGATTPPEDVEKQKLLTKLLFYLLSTGISQLNKAGHPVISAWAKRQPDRVYAWSVEGSDELAAYVRVKGGRSKAARGRYLRSQPFFTMAFDSPRSALGILLETDDMLESTAASKLVMLGAPEFGAELGELMMIVGGYAK